MSFVCFNRIVVTGPRANVLAFRNDARRRLPRSIRPPDDPASVPFSFDRLFEKNRVAGPPDTLLGEISPYHYDSFAEPTEAWRGYIRVVYGLEVKNCEVYELLIPLSRAYPDLCFVDGQLSADDGENYGRVHRAWRMLQVNPARGPFRRALETRGCRLGTCDAR